MQLNRPIIVGSLITVIIIVAGGLFFSGEKLTDYVMNIVTNLMFLIFTLTVVNEITRRQQISAEIRDLLNKIERDSGENSYDAFLEIVSAIRRRKYPVNTLRGVYYQDAQLAGTYLESYHLEDAILRRADFEGASLISIYLQNANLEGANLRDANLTLAHLDGVNLSGADLCGTILKNAILRHSSTQKTVLKGAKFNDKTILNGDTVLPNGIRYRPDEKDEMRIYLEQELGMIWYS